jgi:hypothetical protein
MLRHVPAVVAGAFPVAIGDFRDDFPTFFDGFEYCSDVEVAVECAFDSDLDVVKVNEYSNL